MAKILLSIFIKNMRCRSLFEEKDENEDYLIINVIYYVDYMTLIN